ncbi:hypothetical protein Tsubulata_046434, partial [Turnera subulata]
MKSAKTFVNKVQVRPLLCWGSWWITIEDWCNCLTARESTLVCNHAQAMVVYMRATFRCQASFSKQVSSLSLHDRCNQIYMGSRRSE